MLGTKNKVRKPLPSSLYFTLQHKNGSGGQGRGFGLGRGIVSRGMGQQVVMSFPTARARSEKGRECVCMHEVAGKIAESSHGMGPGVSPPHWSECCCSRYLLKL